MGKKDAHLRELANKIRRRRLDLSISQEKLAELADCNKNSISRIERGETDPSFCMVIKIAYALLISPKDLMPK